MDVNSIRTLHRFVFCTVLISAWMVLMRRGHPALGLGEAMVVASISTSAIAMVRHERFLEPSLNRWDEAIGYLGLGTLVHALA